MTGGELVIESAAGEDAIKLPPGALVAYPATSLHRVNEVTHGVRLAAVGWAGASSATRRAANSCSISTPRAGRYSPQSGKSAEFDLISKSFANLMRMWAED